ncbi:mechanosensitive ion channel family protein [Actinocorallia libanotica]|uniref:Mechanosensitive ion channel n=1 Tax=Actinocorallia libanotica TaxID=46162 RepID=A0ABP4CHU0_9ACTN
MKPSDDPTSTVIGPPLGLAIVLLAIGLVLLTGKLLARRLSRRLPQMSDLAGRTTVPGAVVVGSLVSRATLKTIRVDAGDGVVRLDEQLFGDLAGAVDHLIVLVLIASMTWLVIRVVHVVTRAVVKGVTGSRGVGSTRAKRARTQVMLVNRVVTALAVVIALGWMLFTFDAVRGIGAGVLASAGLFGIIAGVAAQKAIGNLFSGVILAFGDALHVDDVIVVDGYWGKVEDLTLNTVVLQVWDGRRLVLPVSYFTERPYENWTIRDEAIIGAVFLRVDWTVPVADLRTRLSDFVRAHPLWDGEVWNLAVTDVQENGLVEVRALMSAADGSAAFDLRCAVREELIAWIREHHPDSLPRVRADFLPEPA